MADNTNNKTIGQEIDEMLQNIDSTSLNVNAIVAGLVLKDARLSKSLQQSIADNTKNAISKLKSGYDDVSSSLSEIAKSATLQSLFTSDEAQQKQIQDKYSQVINNSLDALESNLVSKYVQDVISASQPPPLPNQQQENTQPPPLPTRS